MTPIETVQAMYAAFARGDIPAILDKLADDVRWEHWTDNRAQKAGVPWLQARTGKAGAAAFFSALAPLTFHQFRVLALMANETQVAAEIELEATMPVGGRFIEEEMHLWTFGADGKVVRFRHYLDTAKNIEAAGL